jgi:parallel beta-helix repeat protein
MIERKDMKKKRNKIQNLSVFAVIIAASLIGAAFSGCDQQSQELVQLALKEIAQERADSIEGFLGTVKIFSDEAGGRKLTPVGDTATRRITIENPGTADLVINDVSVYLQVYDSSEEEMTGEYFQDIFKIVEGTKPDLPLVIPPNGSFSSLYVSFSPVESGETTGVLSLETNAGEKFFRIWGNGAWRLDLDVSGQYGKIVEPIEVEIGEGPKTYYATDNEVTLKAVTLHPQGLWELDEWFIDSGDAVIEDDPDTPDPEWKMLSAVVTLGGHAAIRAHFISPYVYVDDDATGPSYDGSSGDPAASIAAGVSIYNSNSTFPYDLKGICVATGTYTISADETVTRDVIFRGGFRTNFTERDYETAGDRSTYQTLINTTDVSLGFSSSVMDASVLEGFTLQGGTGSAVIPVYTNGSDVTIRYNTITAPVDGYGIGVQNHADPTIENNVIYGANGGLRSVGIYVNDYSDPTIRNNTIIAGNPTSDGGESIAIYVDWFSNPMIDGNILTAGQATGDRGKSAGIYSINSSSPTIKNNIISAGYGKSVSYALYFSYGGWPVIDSNVMFTPESGSQSKYGMYIGSAARIDSMTRNNLYGFPDGFALIYTEDRALKTIEEINDRWVPENSGYEEPDNYSEEP